MKKKGEWSRSVELATTNGTVALVSPYKPAHNINKRVERPKKRDKNEVKNVLASVVRPGMLLYQDD